MATTEELVRRQDDTAIEINKLISNVKKAAKEKRTLEFYNRKAQELAALWQIFESNDNKIRRASSVVPDHPYLQGGLYEKIGQRHSEAMDEIQAAIATLKSAATTAAGQAQPRETEAKHGLALKLQTLITIIHNKLDELLDDDFGTSSLYVKSRLKHIDSHISTIQQLHRQMCAENIEHDLEDYIKEESLIEDKYIKVLEGQEGTTSPTQPELPIHVPNITIPQFYGDYLQWRGFYELFNEIIHKSPMPTVKKMWFLKTNVKGEAQKLIQHLSLTEANYTTAWNLLQDRYNNMRVLTFTLLEKLTGQNKLSENPAMSAIKNLHDTTQETLSALNNLGVDTTSWGPIIIHLIINKLDKGTHMLYEQSLSSPREIPVLSEFLKFLETRFQSLEAMGQKPKQLSARTYSSATASSNTNYNKCSCCKRDSHPLYRCQRFLSQSAEKRLQHIKWNKLCINCLKPGHAARACPAQHCTKCDLKHNTLLHIDQVIPEISQQASKKAVAPSTVASLQQNNTQQGYIILATARVRIQGNNGQVGEFKALLDSGSQVNIVTSRLVKRLNIKPGAAKIRIEGIGNQSKNSSQRVNVSLQSTASGFKTRLEAIVLPTIISAQPTRDFNHSLWPIPENIQLADPEFNKGGNIDVLLGAEYYFDLLTSGKIQLHHGLPVLQNTKLGWVVSGKLNNTTTETAICAVLGEDDTSDLIQQFWRVDEFESGPDTKHTVEEQNCETQFVQTTRRDQNGRFVVRLPFSNNPSVLGETKGIALSRFQALERRLSRDKTLRSQYTEFMDQYEELGHMTRITDGRVQNPHYYIPHHCVMKPESSTTKLRVVFDASTKSTSGLSLNDILHIGPTTQGDLFGMLLRFRMPRYVFCTDIEKMYRQILLEPTERNMQLILWRRKPDDAISTYRLNTITYGTASAPYLATRCLQHLADENMERYPLGANTLRNDFYVDDGMSGSDSLSTAVEIQRQLKQMLFEAGFRLRKWSANHSQLLEGIPLEDLEISLDFDNQSTKVLGLAWNPKSDSFALKTNVQDVQRTTKRSIVSDVAKIFDPLGIAGPVVVAAKCFIQKLWALQLGWDDSIPDNLSSEWRTFRDNLKELNQVHIRRHITDGQIAKQVQLHTFVDASEKAYGAAIYLRSRLQDGRTIVRLLCAKSRVAPLKRLTLPRLELCAAVLGATLTSRVRKELHLESHRVYFWSDSEIVLHWINSQPASLHTFVANRISKIQELTISSQWRHVSSSQNPADYISRGLSPQGLHKCTIWFYGPIFLHGHENKWPKEFSKTRQPLYTEEFKSNPIAALSTKLTGLEDMIYEINHHDSFKCLQRVVAYVQRFISNAKIPNEDRPQTKSLSPYELNTAMHLILKVTQMSDFKQEITTLRTNKEIHKSSPISSLSPFIDNCGVLRVGGRLEASSLSYDAKHPILLPYNDVISKLIMKMVHIDNYHCGPQTLLAISRQQFWILKGKSMARNIVQNCVRCIRSRPKLLNQVMGDLPASRVTPTRPFIKSGVDYCGPFWVHYKIRGKKPHKVYVAVFVCFTTKAVHLEVVTDLTTEAFIGALKRFIARRGRVQTIYSDNATNFVGARNQLEELNAAIFADKSQEAIVRSCSNNGIEFKFIPPRAPHFGGLWEAAVKSAKQLLLRSVSSASLTHEEFETVIIEIEAILNSRPLTPLSSDPNDLTALTPGHFLIGEPLTAQVDPRALMTPGSLTTRWRLVSQLKHEFWNRWSIEYLHQLQEKQKWKTSSENVQEGQMVIIKEDNVPVMQWPLGRILKTYKGDDGKVRVADIKTGSGITKRPIHRLAPLLQDKVPTRDEAATCLMQPTHARSRPTEDEGSTPPKRTKASTSPILLTMIITLLLTPIVISNAIKIKHFQNNPGIYFEGIGNVNLVTAEWRLMVFYNLAPFHAELYSFQTGLTQLQELCAASQQREMCRILVSNFGQIKDELMEERELFATRRTKRAAFNIVGNVARSLFGVLDSDYADEMSNTIKQAKDQTGYLFELLRNQTSIIDSTINIIKQDEINVQGQLNALIQSIRKDANKLEKESEQISQTELIALLANQMTLTAINLQIRESEIINVLTDAHNGRISPLLLAPHQLKKELTNIKAHLPTASTLPVQNDNLVQLYKLMSAKGAVTRDEVIFEIMLPLVDHQSLDLFNIVPVPTVKNGVLFAVSPESSFLAVNSHRDEYVPFTDNELLKCEIAKDNLFICRNKQFKLGRQPNRNSCEINMFNNKNTTDCNLTRIRGNSTWLQLKNENKWIFSTTTDIEMSSVCGIEREQILVKGSGLIELESNCLVKSSLITIQGHLGYTNNIYTSYTNLRHVTSITTPYEIKRIFNSTDNQLEIHSNQLTALQKQLNEATHASLPEFNKDHHYVVSYTALILAIMLLLALSVMKICSTRHTKNSNNPKQQNPQPTPRTPPITIDIIDT